MRTTVLLVLALCTCIMRASPSVGAGSGYAEYTLRFDTAIMHDGVVLPAGDHGVVVIPPNFLSSTHKLVFLEGRISKASEVRKKAVLELPLTCKSEKVAASDKYKISVRSEAGYSVIFWQFHEFYKGIFQYTCITLIKNIAD